MSSEILSLIEGSFAGVTRIGGVSWRETNVIDDYGSEEERLAARLQDKDECWQDVVKAPPWLEAWGSFSFIDPIGFRYYLPAAMTVAIVNRELTYEIGLEFHLTLPRLALRSFTLEKWSLLNDAQRVCVARFLLYMMAKETEWSALIGAKRIAAIGISLRRKHEGATRRGPFRLET
jgi:hypothetical protein